MKKLIKPHNRRKELNILIISSALILTLLAVSSVVVSINSLQFTFFLTTGYTQVQKYTEIFKGLGHFGLALILYENVESFKTIGQIMEIIYNLRKIGAAIIICLFYLHITTDRGGFVTNFLKIPYSLNIRNIAEVEKPAKKKEAYNNTDADSFQLYISIPILCIIIAELLIFLGKVTIAFWLHVGIVFALSISNMFIKDPEVHKIYMPLMLLSILRITTLSIPIFFKTTLYSFILIYSFLAIPVAAIIIHQRHFLEEMGITLKNFLTYMVIALPLSFILGLGEYLIIRPGYLIPDLEFWNLLELAIIMVFFISLVEELIFRSILQTRLEKALSVQKTLIITGLLYGLMHSGYGTFYEIFYTSILGFIMGLIFYKTRSLPFVVILHGFINVFLYGILPIFFLN